MSDLLRRINAMREWHMAGDLVDAPESQVGLLEAVYAALAAPPPDLRVDANGNECSADPCADHGSHYSIPAPPPDPEKELGESKKNQQNSGPTVAASPAAVPSTGRAEPWWGHRFKEFSKGVWTCDCGKTIREVDGAMSAFRETMMEERIERAFWEFDAERKRTGAERDAFKRQLRHLVRAYVTAANLAHKESAGAPLVCSGCGEALPDGYEDDEPVDCRECGNMETAARGEPSAAPTPEREARASAVIGGERDGRTESVPPAAPQPATLNNDEVICPHCTHQFRAIPVNVQKLLLSLGAEPPFRAAPQTPAEPGFRIVGWREVPEGCTIFPTREEAYLLYGCSIQPVYVSVASPHSAGPAAGSVVVEADSNAVPSTLSVPRSLPK